MKLFYLIGLILSTDSIQQGHAVENATNATNATKTSIQNKYAVTEDADENKKKIVIEKQSKAQSSWRAKYAPESVWTGSEAELTQDQKDYPLKCVWTKSKGLEVWRDSGRSLEEAEKCCIYIWLPGRQDRRRRFMTPESIVESNLARIWRHSGTFRNCVGNYLDICFPRALKPG